MPPTKANDQEGPSANQQNPTDELVDTRVYILWTPAADTHIAASPTPSTLPLFLYIRYDTALSMASVQLQLRGVALKKGVRKSFYLLIPPERIDTLFLANTEFSTLIGDDVYRLDMTLAEPLDLVGPRSNNHEAGWPQGKGDIKQLRSVAQALRFTILLPTAKVTKSQLLDFCTAVSRQGGLRSLPGQCQRLYGGAGGYVYPVQRRSPAGLPAPGPASDTSTDPADTPPEYHVHPPVPGHSNTETSPPQAKAPGKRQGNRDPAPCPPLKRRSGDLPAYTVDLAPSTATRLTSDCHQEAELLLRTQPGVGDLVGVLLRQSQAIEQLRGEVGGLRQRHAELTTANTELERQMNCQARAFEEGLRKVESIVRDWVPNPQNMRDKAEIELRPLVSGIVDDIFEDVPDCIEEVIQGYVYNEVESRFSTLRDKIREAFEVDEPI